MPDTHVDLTIRFPSRKALMSFCEWMSDGGGEFDFIEFSKWHIDGKAIGRMQYHSEDMSLPKDDPKRYGPFMADNLIIAHQVETEQS